MPPTVRPWAKIRMRMALFAAMPPPPCVKVYIP
eukprot:CAMPEP_0205827238 /NCGR_PEP_ID=MMETSP0206-20130828/31373_1 /ASSEMBLY_ACC=CAM_ASM_000279 /TAXON_ID=36767 /ORGANISM="Euplotes focardii, Strain TN1" /LENGTH=32 /DNA_ID= /DNA_START= /DNA_END= /DNA_ORIENTATION=